MTFEQSDVVKVKYHLRNEEMKQVDKCLKVSLGIE